MGLKGALAALASGARVPVFVVGGATTADARRALRLHDEVEVVDSPRAANVLVVAAPLPEPLEPAARACHDQLSPPRLTVEWSPGRAHPGGGLPAAAQVTGGVDDLVATVVAAHRDLLAGRRASEAFLLPEDDPVPWRGVGPYGQGGKGMTGGTPFGRPLAGRAPDRDGLQLDQVPLTVGPYFSALPPGLVLEVKLQGDVVQEVVVGPNPFSPTRGLVASPFGRALAGPVAVAELELARARHHLGWLGDALRVQGLAAMGRRALALAHHLAPPDGEAVADLAAAVRRSGVLTWSLGGGGLAPAAVAGRGLGPVARAAGVAADARTLDPGYQALGFEPVVGGGGDSRARWEQHLAETAQSLELARRAGDRCTTRTDVVESPRGPLEPGTATPSSALVELLPEAMTGLEWGDAVAAVVSLDLDVAEAASRVSKEVPA